MSDGKLLWRVFLNLFSNLVNLQNCHFDIVIDGAHFRGNRILAAKLEEVLTQRSPTDSN